MTLESMTDEAVSPPVRVSLSKAFDNVRLPPSVTADFAAAAAKASRIGGTMAEATRGLTLPAAPARSIVPDLTTSLVDFDFGQLPEARTARATEEMAERLDEYQANVAALVEALRGQADEQRERAERAEARELRADERNAMMLRLTWIMAALTLLTVVAAMVALVV